MISRIYDGGMVSPIALALAAGIGIFSTLAVVADGGGFADTGQVQQCGKCGVAHHVHGARGGGLGAHGRAGLDRGFQGFGLGFHLDNGYGGRALGVGADGGHPLYGGPGYPHAEPTLRRHKRIVPFPYYGGHGHPSPGHPHYFGSVGPLGVDQPVVKLGTADGYLIDAGGSGYGPFTGEITYPDTLFGPFSATPVGTSGGGSSAHPAPTSSRNDQENDSRLTR